MYYLCKRFKSYKIHYMSTTISNYCPSPIDTSDITLLTELFALADDIAKNVHEVWARQRMKEGWVYGAQRNDTLKQHPCLIPYEALSESEKDYDRNTALETLKLITQLGFTITKPTSSEAGESENPSSAECSKLPKKAGSDDTVG